MGTHNRIIPINDDAPVSGCDTGIDIQVPDSSSSDSSDCGGSGGSSSGKHNDLLNIQGGDVNNRYHLTKPQWDAVQDANAPSSANPFATIADIQGFSDFAEEIAELQENLAAETAARISSDSGLADGISANNTAISAVATNLATEVTARTTADTTLQNNITTEVGNRTSADVYLQGEIDAIKAATIIHPTYVAPAITITSPQTGTNYEIGQSVSAALTVNYTQNDGGTATYQILKGGTLLSATQTYTDPIVITAAGVTYQGKATYIGTQPPYKTNNFGDPDSTGIIPAGNITSAAIAIRGFYREFWGPVATAPIDSPTVRALPSNQLTSGANPFTLNTGTTLLKFAFWLPTGKTLVSVKDSTSSNADITTQFISSAVNVFDASGTSSVPGTLYVMTVAQAYSPSHAFLITTN